MSPAYLHRSVYKLVPMTESVSSIISQEFCLCSSNPIADYQISIANKIIKQFHV